VVPVVTVRPAASVAPALWRVLMVRPLMAVTVVLVVWVAMALTPQL
jgi:hypothetical protein